MDLLTVLEPQLAIPVIGAVVCGVLVYMFGFQQTQEPSFEHLAVLHNRPKREVVSNSTSSRQQQRAPTSPQGKSASGRSKEKASAPSSPKEKTTATRSSKRNSKEGPAEKAVVNGAVRTGKGKRAVETPKESPKKKGKQANAAPASDDMGGDWTSVPSRKSKSGRSRKE